MAAHNYELYGLQLCMSFDISPNFSESRSLHPSNLGHACSTCGPRLLSGSGENVREDGHGKLKAADKSKGPNAPLNMSSSLKLLSPVSKRTGKGREVFKKQKS